MANVDASARHRRLITFSVLGIIILGLCACNNLLPGNLLADRLGPQEVPKYDYYELDDRSYCPVLPGAGDYYHPRVTSCFYAFTETTDERLLALIVKDMVHKQGLTGTTDGEKNVVWVQFDNPNDSHDNFEVFATGFYFEDKDDVGLVLSDYQVRRATVVDNVYVLEGYCTSLEDKCTLLDVSGNYRPGSSREG